MKSYKDLDIYNLACDYAVPVHRLTLLLPKMELYEQGNQIRRSSKNVKDNIVEGYGRRRDKQDFIKFLIHTHPSLLDCTSQLERIQRLYPELKTSDLRIKYNNLGAYLYAFIQSVKSNWKSEPTDHSKPITT